VPAAVAGQKGDALAFQRAHNVGVRRRAERCLQRDLFDILQLLDGINATAANDADANRFRTIDRHALLPKKRMARKLGGYLAWPVLLQNGIKQRVFLIPARQNWVRHTPGYL